MSNEPINRNQRNRQRRQKRRITQNKMKQKNKQINQRFLTNWLIAAYFILLVVVVVFKIEFPMGGNKNLDDINLIIIIESIKKIASIAITQLITNAIIFVPLGIYISMLKKELSLFKKIVFVGHIALFFEIAQYILSDRQFNISNILVSSVGGILGIVIYTWVDNETETDFTTNKAFNIILCIITIVVVDLIIFGYIR